MSGCSQPLVNEEVGECSKLWKNSIAGEFSRGEALEEDHPAVISDMVTH